jgi:DNA helicase-2/ATP-dependent DNA helicase PcrA
VPDALADAGDARPAHRPKYSGGNRAEEGSPLKSHDVRRLLSFISAVCEEGSAASARFSFLPDADPNADAYTLLSEVLFGEAGWARTVEDAAATASLLHAARAFRERGSVFLAAGENPGAAFLHHVRRMARLDVPLLRERDGDAAAPRGVRVLTAHAAKGLEFPVVFVPNLSEGKFPSRPRAPLIPPLRL